MSTNGVDGSTPRRRKVDPEFLLFAGVTTVISGVVAVAARFSDQSWLTGLIPVVPGAAAMGLLVWRKRTDELKTLTGALFHASVDRNWVLASVLLFPLIALVAVGLYAVSGSADLQFGPMYLLPVIAAVPLMLANEFGWRGYALGLFSVRVSAFARSMAIGVAWTVSVAPIYLVPGGLANGVELYQLALAMVPASTILVWLRVNTKSLIMPALFGAMAIIMPSLLPILPGDAAQGVTFWLVIALLWVAALLVVFYYGTDGLDKTSRELPPDELPVEWERIMPKAKPTRGTSNRPVTDRQRAKKFSGIGKRSRQ